MNPKPSNPKLLQKECKEFLVLWDEYWNTGAFAGPPWATLQEAAERIRKQLEKEL